MPGTQATIPHYTSPLSRINDSYKPVTHTHTHTGACTDSRKSSPWLWRICCGSQCGCGKFVSLCAGQVITRAPLVKNQRWEIQTEKGFLLSGIHNFQRCKWRYSVHVMVPLRICASVPMDVILSYSFTLAQSLISGQRQIQLP